MTGRNRRGAIAGAIGSIGVVVVAVMLAACETGSNPDFGGPVYPADKAQAGTLDIQVVRDETSLRMTNTTARAYGRSRLWINRWYSREVEGFAVGETLVFSLKEFKDPYGESFRGGGFFATREPERLAQAQLETADSVVGLVVVGRGE